MNRDYSVFNSHLNILADDDYGQVPDKGHIRMIRAVFHHWISKLDAKSVLDVGCGSVAIAEPFFRSLGVEYTGIALGLDAQKAKAKGKNVMNMDMTFTTFKDRTFDLIYARHVAEHSPMPLLTLMEWYRISKAWLCLIVPDPRYYGRTGLNHYSVLDIDHWNFLAERAGWSMIWRDLSNPTEFRMMFEKKKEEYQRHNES